VQRYRRALANVFPNVAYVACIDLLPGCGQEVTAQFVGVKDVVSYCSAKSAGMGATKFSLHILNEVYHTQQLAFYGTDAELPDTQSVRGGEMSSCICAPLWRRNEISGFLHMHTLSGLGRPFARRDAQLFWLLANISSQYLNRAADAKQRSTMRAAAAAGLAVSGLAHDSQSILRTLGLNMEGVEKTNPEIMANACWKDVKEDLELLRFISRDAIERLETATGELVMRSVQLHPIVEEIIQRCSDYFLDHADRSRVRVVNACDKSHRAMVDPQGLKQVLMNCVKNSLLALKKSDNGHRDQSDYGEIKVFSCRDSEMPDDYCLVSVCDSAGGISEKVLQQLGEPFVTTEQTKRLGLGMYIAMEIVERMGGQIRIASSTKPAGQYPTGTVLSLCLPISSQAPKPVAIKKQRFVLVADYAAYRSHIEGLP